MCEKLTIFPYWQDIVGNVVLLAFWRYSQVQDMWSQDRALHLAYNASHDKLEIRSMERGICPIAMLALCLTLYSLTGSRVWPIGSLDVIGHVTIGTADGPFLLVVCWCQVTVSHGCQDIEHQTFQGHDLDPFGSRDVIGHVTIRTADGHFLLVIHWHHVPISQRCWDIKRHNLDNHITIVNTLESNFGEFWGLG